jgi:hypothetical protein
MQGVRLKIAALPSMLVKTSEIGEQCFSSFRFIFNFAPQSQHVEA